MSLEVNSLRVAEARHTQTETTSGLILLCMVLLEPGYRVYVYSQNEDNKLQTLDKKEPLFRIFSINLRRSTELSHLALEYL